MRISDWSSNVCSSDLPAVRQQRLRPALRVRPRLLAGGRFQLLGPQRDHPREALRRALRAAGVAGPRALRRSEEHTSELQSLMRISYAVLCLKKKINNLLIQKYDYALN